MSYVIMNVGTELLYRKPGDHCAKDYPTERGAKSACTKLNKSYGNVNQWVVMSARLMQQLEASRKPVKMKKVKNLMSGVEIEIAEDTPLCCDPSSETYWSM